MLRSTSLSSYFATWTNAFGSKNCWRDIITTPRNLTGRHISGGQNVVKNNRTIRTLDPGSLQSKDFLDVTGRRSLSLRLEKEGKIRMVYRLIYDCRQILCFPDATKGFLYYSPRPPLPPRYGEVRFRLTQSSDPISFDHGTDLLDRFGRPWSMKQTDAKLRRLLVEDGLVAPSEPLPSWNMISTFRRDRLKPADFINFSGGRDIILYTKYGRVALFYHNQLRKDRISPERSEGFLYYYHPPNLPPGCGELRLRITGDPDPGLFQQGSDLLSPNGSPWNLPLPSISHYSPIKKVLVDDGLVAPSLLSMIEDARPSRRVAARGVNLFKIDQPWTLDISCSREIHVNSSSSNSFKAYLTRDARTGVFPYTGKVVGQFEVCTSPTGVQHLQFRVLEIVEPVKCVIPDYDGRVVIPTVGNFISLRSPHKVRPRKIRLSEDTLRAKQLRLLLPDPPNNVAPRARTKTLL